MTAASFLGTMPEEDIGAVMQHPAQQSCVHVIASLIDELRACRTWDDLDDFQRRLFHHLFEVENHRAEVRRCHKRLKLGKTLTFDVSKLPAGANPQDVDTWRIEDLVTDRMCRQLRALGDALAWRASSNDRRYVLALSNNPPAGPMASKEGLGHELGAAVEMRARGNFGLLHDLTNCLRIADLTQFSSDGKLLYEIKKNPNAKRGPQLRRMSAAVEAVMNGGELPGIPGSAFVKPTVTCRTHLGSLRTTMAEAQQHAIAAKALPGHRALIVLSSPGLVRAGTTLGPADLASRRAGALQSAGLLQATHHVSLNSAVRNRDHVPSVVPFALYPLPPGECALLICDYIVFEVVIDPQSLAAALARHGVAAEAPLGLASTGLSANDTVLSMRKGSRSMTLSPGGLYELLMEFNDINTWAAAVAEILEAPESPRHPVVAFTTTKVWW